MVENRFHCEWSPVYVTVCITASKAGSKGFLFHKANHKNFSVVDFPHYWIKIVGWPEWDQNRKNTSSWTTMISDSGWHYSIHAPEVLSSTFIALYLGFLDFVTHYLHAKTDSEKSADCIGQRTVSVGKTWWTEPFPLNPATGAHYKFSASPPDCLTITFWNHWIVNGAL